MSDAEPRQLLSREERQASILAGAARAFAGGGYAATSMDDVAAASGITKLIVYRHFDSKADLYRAVLDRVASRQAEEFLRRLNAPEPRGSSVRTFLTVAREDPDGFVLLWRHAAREAEFANDAASVRAASVQAAEGLIGDTIADAGMRRWASRTIVSYLVEATLHWLEVGTPDRDEDFVTRATDGLVAMYGAWSSAAGPRRP